MHLDNGITAGAIVEIHSGYYEDTLRKALITATDLLRLCRMYSDTQNITAFCFPKLKTKLRDNPIKENKQCVVKLDITWQNFDFQYRLTPIEIHEVKEHIIQVFNGFMALTGPEQISKVVMRLSIAELDYLGHRFGGQFTQMSSKNAMKVK